MQGVKCFETSPPATRSVIRRHLVHVEMQSQRGWCVIVASVRVAKISPAAAANLYWTNCKNQMGFTSLLLRFAIFGFCVCIGSGCESGMQRSNKKNINSGIARMCVNFEPDGM
jgi:hypothetical protein